MSTTRTAGSRTLLGIDVGLSGVRVAAIDERGDMIGTASARLGGRRCVGTDAWWAAVETAVRQAGERAGGGVAAVQVAGYGPVPVVLDRGGRVRFVGEVTSSASPAEQVASALAHGPLTGLASDELVEVDIAGLVAGRLVGRPLLDALTAADHVGTPVATPAPGDTFTAAGGVTADVARRTGLPEGTPVGHGAIDSWIDLRALGVDAPGDAGLLLGSTLVLGVVDGRPAEHGLVSAQLLGGAPFLGGWTSSAGSALDWLDGVVVVAEDDEVGRLQPGAGGLLALNHLHGERAPLWDDDARGAIVGLTAATSATELRRAVVDGIALSALDLAVRLQRCGVEVGRWRAGGGGFRSAPLARAVCDALGVPLDVIDVTDGRGAARCAAPLVGIELPPPPARTLDPDPARHERYRALGGVRDRLVEALSATVHELSALARVDLAPVAEGSSA